MKKDDTITLPRSVVKQALEAYSGLLTYNTSNAEYAAGRLAIKSLQAALRQDQVEYEPVAYEYVEHRQYGTPGEIKRSAILLEHYRNADGTIAEDWELLVEQFKNAKTTISIRPLYTHQQPSRQPLTDEQKAAVTRELNMARCLEKRVIGNVELTDRIASAIERAHEIGSGS